MVRADPDAMTQGLSLDQETRAYVRGLARHLARGDVHLAEEIEQETFVLALQNRPRDPAATRAWLRAVARSCWIGLVRRGGRGPRRVAFDDALHGEGYEDPADALGGAETRRVLEEALARLPERYAAVIGHRVLDGMPPREVAAQLGVPVNTVRTRTRRGFDQLRADVEAAREAQAHRDARPLVALAAFPWRRSRRAWWAAAAAVPAAVAGWFLFTAGGARPADPPAPVPETTRMAEAPAPDLSIPPASGREVRPLAIEGASTPPPEAALAPAAAPATIEVMVVGTDGEPVPGAEVFEHVGLFGEVHAVGRADQDGRVEVPLAGANRWVAARGGPGDVSEAVLLDQPSVLAPGRTTLVLASMPVAWIDVDLSAHPAGSDPEARVWLEGFPVDERDLCQTRPVGGLRGSPCWVPSWRDGAGRHGVVWGDVRKRIAVIVDGRAVAGAGPFRLRDHPPAVIRVGRPWALRGRLVTQDGRPVPHKMMRHHTGLPAGNPAPPTTTDSDGRFEVAGITESELRVSAHGLHSRGFQRPDGDVLEAGDVVLDALAEELGIHGRVVGMEPPFVVRSLTRAGRDQPLAFRFAVPRAATPQVVTDPEGRFRTLENATAVEVIMVHRAWHLPDLGGAPDAPPIVMFRPPGGWPRDGIELRATGDPGSRIVAELEPALLPARIELRHRDSGVALLLSVDAQDPFLRSPRLCAGRWDLTLQDAQGQVAPLTSVDLDGRTDARPGPLVVDRGVARVNWSTGLAAGSPDDLVHVTLLRDGAPVLRRAVRRGDLGAAIADLPLPTGAYELVAHAPGGAHRASFEVSAGELVTVTPER